MQGVELSRGARARRMALALLLAAGAALTSATPGAIGGGPALAQGAGVGAAGEGPVTGFPLPRYVSLKSDKTFVRRGPSDDHRIDWEFLRKGMPVRVVAEHGPWRRVQDLDDVTGWVHSIMLSGRRTAVVTAQEGAFLLARPELGADRRAELRAGVVLDLDECEPVWCRAEVDGHDGWIPKADIWGVDSAETFD